MTGSDGAGDRIAAELAMEVAAAGYPVLPDAPFLTGVGSGSWHAISRESMAYLRTGDADTVAFAMCGELVRVAAKHGAYDRTSTPVTYDPCQACAWTVAAANGTLDREIALLVPEAMSALPALAAVMPDPVIAVSTCRGILARAHDSDYWGREPGHPAIIQLLATVAAHAPVLLVSEGCAEGDHDHKGPCEGRAACEACSLRAGEWAGEWAGQFREECTIKAPCQVLLTLAAHAGVVIA